MKINYHIIQTPCSKDAYYLRIYDQTFDEGGAEHLLPMSGLGFDEITVFLSRTTKGGISVQIKFWFNYTGLKLERLFDFVSPEGQVLNRCWIPGVVIEHYKNRNHYEKNTMLKIQYDDGDILTICSDFVDGKSTSCVWQDKNMEPNKTLCLESRDFVEVGGFYPDKHVFFDDQGNRS